MASSPTNRRVFLRQTGLAAASLLCAKLPAFATSSKIEGLAQNSIPLDKKLDAQWLKSLYERGNATTYLKTKNELQYLGMPVGGINAGGVYLGGDGRLWLWDIFNRNQEGVEPKVIEMNIALPGEWRETDRVRSRDGACYVEPAQDIRPLAQGFALKFEWEGKTIVKQLAEQDWDEIAFRATYPVATISYTDKHLPAEVIMEAYSPFIPLDEVNSGLPATIITINVKNTSTVAMKVTALGFLENKTGIYNANPKEHRRENTAVSEKGMTGIFENLDIISEKEERRKILTSRGDYGNMFIGSLHSDVKVNVDVDLPITTNSFEIAKTEKQNKSTEQSLIGSVAHDMNIASGTTAQSHFVIAWYFPNFQIKDIPDTGRFYQKMFTSSTDIATYVQKNFLMLSSQTKLWAETWQDSSLPHWFLERTFLNISTLATTTCHRFASGRFWAWEGVGACEGTCTHVWQYAQAMGRLFPALERDMRERVDLRIAMQEDGGILFRGELGTHPAIDGQAGTVLRIYREHQMSTGNDFLQRNWDKIKKATQFIINQDKNSDGMEDTPMENTLDAVWDGEIAWIVGICLTAVKAGELMAIEMNDQAFAKRCSDYVKKGSRNMEKYLFNGEYFIHRPDMEKGRKNLGSYNTCHIDQVYGEAWTHQVGIERLIDRNLTLSALKSLWKYNYTPNVGPYIKTHQGGRPYALPGEGGMIMNTNPRNEEHPYGDNVTWQLGYFHECMSGFEHQVAAHMMAEGMVQESLVLTRSIHERYHAAKRNPFNEIECSDHYARAMASYGTFITACGFSYHGPKGILRFAPKIQADQFKAAFVTAEGWGSYSQDIITGKQTHSIELKSGKLRLLQFGLEIQNGKAKSISININGNMWSAFKTKQQGHSLSIIFGKEISLQQGDVLQIAMA